MQKISLEEKFSLFAETWAPRLLGAVNETEIKIVRLEGEFVWHCHETADELFLVLEGRLAMRYMEEGRVREEVLGPEELVIVPRGVRHCPVCTAPTKVLLVEPANVVNTGDAGGGRTREAKPV